MANQTIQVVWAHPRTDSITADVVQDVIETSQHFGATVDVLDLYRHDFIPTLFQECLSS